MRTVNCTNSSKHSECCVQCPWTQLDPRHCFQKTSLIALGPKKEEKQVMLQLACDDKILSRQTLLRYCAWSSSFDLFGKCLLDLGHTRQSFATWQNTGLRCPCARILWVATAFGRLLKILLHSGHVLCSTVNATGAPERSMFPHSSASSSKSSWDRPTSLRFWHLPALSSTCPGAKSCLTPTRANRRRGLQDWLLVQIR